jgi:hypothetical protein
VRCPKRVSPQAARPIAVAAACLASLAGAPPSSASEAASAGQAADAARAAGRGAQAVASITPVGPLPRTNGAGALKAARRVTSYGVRPGASRAERRAHGFVERAFRRAGLNVAVQGFRVPGHGRSRNVIATYDAPRRNCLRIVMAHTDTTAFGPGANDNASGVGVVVALAKRLRRLSPTCDTWLVATGAEERIYTGSPDHLGALALARRARTRGAARRLRFALSLDEVGGDRPFWLRSPAPALRPSVEGAILRAADRAGVNASWVPDGSDSNSDHREFELLGLPAAKLGVGAGDNPCRHMPCDTALDRHSLALAQRLAERSLTAR